ncbi:DUF7455 domain-containing protein [Kribbella sp. WER1]
MAPDATNRSAHLWRDLVTALQRLHDRCDRCGAQAFVRASLEVGYLLFCAHHYAAHEVALLEAGATILDERHLINTAPSPSADA